MITIDDVDAYFEEVHGHRPFPWQQRLAEAALSGQWPEAVDAPTGLGKTWSIDVALLAMADAGLRGNRGTFRRILFVVDRRTVVDEAWAHTERVAERLRSARPGTIAHTVAQGLRALTGHTGGDAAVLSVVRMRGGATWESLWADRPDQPMVVLSTIDQVGSRLLFRGYGVSDAMRPIHAALVGCHSLMILDEVHLAGPFVELVARVRALQGGSLAVAGLRTLLLSATYAGDAPVMAFDEPAHLAHPVAGPRLASDKRLAVVESGASQRAKAITAIVRAIRAGGDARVLVVCNTVGSARAAHDALCAADVRAGLLTGRSRPFDRERVTSEWLSALGPSTAAPEAAVLVATQTVEVGVNLDVDWLITEECALNALVQRLGRVNRFGQRPGAAVVLFGSGDDPVYGTTAGATTAWLQGVGAPILGGPRGVTDARAEWLDVSPLALRRAVSSTDRERLLALNPRPESAPLIDGALFQRWAQTSPVPLVDVPVEQYLHGLGPADSSVALAWRADLQATPDGSPHTSPHPLDVPVSAAETVELPLASLRARIAGTGGSRVADLESGASLEDDPVSGGSVARVTGDGNLEWVGSAALRPGDTVVLPASWGWLDRWGWAPASAAQVTDVSPLVDRRGRFLILLDEATLRPLVQGSRPDGGYGPEQDEAWAPVAGYLAWLTASDAEPPEDGLPGLRTRLLAACGAMTDPDIRRLINALDVGRLAGRVVTLAREQVEQRAGIVQATDLSAAGGVAASLAVGAADGGGASDLAGAADDRADSTVAIGRRVALADHSRAVSDRARSFAEALGLDESLRIAVTRAAEWHDLGKIDPRFQAQLWGGARPHTGVPLLAKSGISRWSPLWREARRLSGYPAGLRHEALSAKLARQLLAGGSPAPDGDADPALIVHLIAAHHGRARPLLSTVDDPDPQRVTWSDGDQAVAITTETDDGLELVGDFDRLNRAYGYWGLALLEAIVRLADIGCSSEGS